MTSQKKEAKSLNTLTPRANSKRDIVSLFYQNLLIDLDRVGHAVTVVLDHHSNQLLKRLISHGNTAVSIWWHDAKVTVEIRKITVTLSPNTAQDADKPRK